MKPCNGKGRRKGDQKVQELPRADLQSAQMRPEKPASNDNQEGCKESHIVVKHYIYGGVKKLTGSGVAVVQAGT